MPVTDAPSSRRGGVCRRRGLLSANHVRQYPSLRVIALGLPAAGWTRFAAFSRFSVACMNVHGCMMCVCARAPLYYFLCNLIELALGALFAVRLACRAGSPVRLVSGTHGPLMDAAAVRPVSAGVVAFEFSRARK